jgi:membrane protein
MMWGLVKATLSEWSEDEVPRLGAALAYYAVFSLAPLLVIVIAIVGFFYRGDSAAQIEQQIATHLGAQVAGMLAQAIDSTNDLGSGIAATAIGLVVLVLGATGVFVELRAAMNKIFEIQPVPSTGIWGFVRDRAKAFAMVLTIAFLLLVSMILSAALSTVMTHFSYLLPAGGHIWNVLELALSFGVITLLFALMFRYVPDDRLPWRDVWLGAAVTSALFVIGKFLIGLYIANGAVGSTFGAAGALVVLLAWVYYSAQIVFLGAEFTQTYISQYGSHFPPDRRRTAA